MGTRNSTLVKVDGEYKVAKYCQWDGYPSGQGVIVLDILRSCDLNDLKEKSSKVTEISEEKVKRLWEDCGADGSEFVDMKISQKFKERNFHLHRDCGGLILNEIISGNCTEMLKDVNFATNDGLFCEWAYVVDFDRNVFEVYSGTVKNSNKVKSYSLDSLPTENDFLNDF